LIKSQFVILKLGRLEQTTNFHSALSLFVFGVLSCQFALFSEEFGVVTREFLERN
jgi:hypothetical protein